METSKDSPIQRFKWHIVTGGAILVVLVLLVVAFVRLSSTSQAGSVLQLLVFLGILALLIPVLIMLAKMSKILNAATETSSKLDKIASHLEKNHSILKQINQNTRLSEAARAVAFRDTDKQALREVVFDKLQQQDFDATYKIIDEIAQCTEYQELANQLRIEADKYRDATDQERINQVIAHIEKLLDSYQWAKASAQIERLIKDYPNSEKAKAMRQRLVDKKEERKKVLLTAWDDAVKRQATDRSLEILRELDMYLTPNEGLALQEAARDVFRTKLHNLGVQFSLAVSGKQWADALQIGQQIIRDFPNSRMAEEIRERMDVLRQKVANQAS